MTCILPHLPVTSSTAPWLVDRRSDTSPRIIAAGIRRSRIRNPISSNRSICDPRIAVMTPRISLSMTGPPCRTAAWQKIGPPAGKATAAPARTRIKYSAAPSLAGRFRQESLMGKKDRRVDDYIARSAPFAKPILRHLRSVVHAACPSIEETLKWSSPSFTHKGIVCGMAAFKEHCVFGFWKEALLRDRIARLPRGEGEAMGQFGRITSLSQLPGDQVLMRLVRAAVELNERGIKSPTRKIGRASCRERG